VRRIDFPAPVAREIGDDEPSTGPPVVKFHRPRKPVALASMPHCLGRGGIARNEQLNQEENRENPNTAAFLAKGGVD
jgi:hypothetical protein